MSQRRLTMAARRVDDAWWLAGGAPTPVAAYQPLYAPDLATSYLRVAGTGGNSNLDPAVVGAGVAPTWASGTGWGLDGTTQFLVSGVSFPANSGCVIARYSGTSGNFRTVVGEFLAPAFWFIRSNSANVEFYGLGVGVQNTPQLLGGVYGVSGNIAYRNGVAEPNTAGGTSQANNLYIGALRTAGVAQFFLGDIQAVAFWNTPLTASQVAAVSAAMAAL